jgi:hypothetical protein
MPPRAAAARTTNPFDDQLAALRQRIALPRTLPATDEVPRATTSTSGTSSFIYGGCFTAPAPPPKVPLSSSHQTVDGNTASMLETLRYLKRAAKDRMEEFLDMNEQFTYNAEEEEANFLKKQAAQLAARGQPLVTHYEDPLQDPFVFNDVDEAHAASARQGPPSTGSGNAFIEKPSRGDGGGRSFEASYDVSTALVAPTSRRSAPTTPALVGHLGVGASQHNASSASSAVGASMFSSQIPSLGGSTTRHGIKSATLGTQGTVVAQSSVSVASHIRRGAARLVATEHVQAPSRGGPRKQIQRHRPSCTVEVREPAGIRFCTHCGHCTITSGSSVDDVCGGCGNAMHHRRTTSQCNNTLPSEDDSEALLRIEDLERQEALAFQAAIAEWRGEQGTTTTKVLPLPHPATDCSPASATGTFLVPRGMTYFSQLWEQLHTA